MFVEGGKQRSEEHLATLGDATTDDNKFQVQSRRHRCNGNTHCATGSSKSSRGRVITEASSGRESPSGLFARPSHLNGMSHNRWSASDPFNTAAAAADTFRTIMFGDDVANVTGITRVSIDPSAIENQAAANSR
jgi:hypothetical protein